MLPVKMDDALIDRIRESFFPTTCSFCRKRCRPDETPFFGICRRCLRLLPLRKGEERLVRLRAAADDIPPAICASYYEGIVRKSLIRMKFGDAPEICATFADLIADAMLRTVPDMTVFSAVVAVPLHRNREKERGYNQAAVIAGALGRRLLLPDWSACFGRSRATGRQSELMTMAERRDNVAGAFVVRHPSMVNNRQLILVDDILSTGATILALRQSALAAGASSVMMVAASSGYSTPVVAAKTSPSEL